MNLLRPPINAERARWRSFQFASFFGCNKAAQVLLVLVLIQLTGCGSDRIHGGGQVGMASWYGGSWNGKPTANGEIFNSHDFTAAHRTLPFNTIVLVENLRNGRKVKVRINDRGPFSHGRIIDLSEAAAHALAVGDAGVVKVKIRVVDE